MIYVCVACDKKFLYKGDPSTAPRCSKCGGALRAEEGASAAGPDPRVKELEARVQALERSEAGARTGLQAKERELEETRRHIAELESRVEASEKQSDDKLRAVQGEMDAKGKMLGDAQETARLLDAAKASLIIAEGEREALKKAVADRERKVGQLENHQRNLQDSLAEAISSAEREAARRKSLEGKGGAPSATGEKDKIIADLQKTIASQKANEEALQKALEDVSSGMAAPAAPAVAGPDLRAAVADLENGVEALLALLGEFKAKLSKVSEPPVAATVPPRAPKVEEAPDLESAMKAQDEVLTAPGGDEMMLDMAGVKKFVPPPPPPVVPIYEQSAKDDVIALPDSALGSDETMLDFGRVKKEMPSKPAAAAPPPAPPAPKREIETAKFIEDVEPMPLSDELTGGDQTLLDMGKMGHKIRERMNAPKPPAPSAARSPVAPPPWEKPPAPAAGRFPAAPAPVKPPPPPPPPEDEKKGLFSKWWGKKK